MCCFYLDTLLTSVVVPTRETLYEAPEVSEVRHT